MHSLTQTTHDEVVPVPLIVRPSRSHYIRSRELGHLCSDKLPIDKQLHLNAPPRISIIHHPTRNTLRRSYSFTPTMKRWWKQLHIDHDCNRSHQNSFKD